MRISKLASAAFALSGLAVLPAWGPAQAQPYPTRPVRIISPFAAGGSNDTVARAIAPRLAAALGQQFIVENRPGAGGAVGTERGAKAAPDGHTLTVVTNSTLAIVPALRQVPYDPVKDFAPIGMIGVSPYVVIVHPSVPAHSIKELVALVKSRPGDVDYGSGGVGTPGQGLAIDFQIVTDIRAFQVETNGGQHANVEISVKLLNDRNGTVRATRVFSATSPVQGSGNRDYIAALDRAFAQVSTEIVAWTLKAI